MNCPYVNKSLKTYVLISEKANLGAVELEPDKHN
jgi:hypothetical protein